MVYFSIAWLGLIPIIENYIEKEVTLFQVLSGITTTTGLILAVWTRQRWAYGLAMFYSGGKWISSLFFLCLYVSNFGIYETIFGKFTHKAVFFTLTLLISTFLFIISTHWFKQSSAFQKHTGSSGKTNQ